MIKPASDSQSELAAKIKQARQQSGLSQKQLGSALRISDRTVSAYEVGRAEPSLDMLKQISQITAHPLPYFMGESSQQLTADIQARLAKIEGELAAVKKLLNQLPANE
jgi:transcriptional regulator with XRE-family HTH domain